MDIVEFQELMHRSFLANGLAPLNADDAIRFYTLTNHLLEVNKITNLTAVEDIEGIICKHYIDSLFSAPLLPLSARVLDIGCGPGFPSLPLALFRSDLSIVALDSTSKKIDFVKQSADLLRLKNLKAVSARAEDPTFKEANGLFDCVVSRAVARLNILCELSLPLLRLGGKLVALKGARAQEEIDEAKKAISILGGKLTACTERPLVIGDESQARFLIEITKVSPTPKRYPRPYAAISKQPL